MNDFRLRDCVKICINLLRVTDKIQSQNSSSIETRHIRKMFTLESRIIGGVGTIGGLDIVIIINNRGDWTGLKK